MLKRIQELEAWEPQINQVAFEALDMAIEALSQESSEDVISRQAAIDLLKQMRKDGNMVPWEGKDVFDRIRKLPSVQPEPQWIPCSERLPDTPHYYEEDEFRESDFILIYTKINDIENESNIYVAQYCIDDGDKTGYFVVPFCGDTFREGVTAWMPLPKPYKAESEG